MRTFELLSLLISTLACDFFVCFFDLKVLLSSSFYPLHQANVSIKPSQNVRQKTPLSQQTNEDEDKGQFNGELNTVVLEPTDEFFRMLNRKSEEERSEESVSTASDESSSDAVSVGEPSPVGLFRRVLGFSFRDKISWLVAVSGRSGDVRVILFTVKPNFCGVYLACYVDTKWTPM
ncbi:unnamed protein product [Dibothriocephalus latus]|uniref:Uncharacterized protein n=1 Tax=Dibothriocephalus latus TaxID=60516 RepID=A0A3P7L6Y6_DIBLA|nr:unnamed protein product [Dibothriocephalus latus]